jgi:hypothetical protein
MSESFKLGDIIDLVSNLKQVTSILDGAKDADQLKVNLSDMLEDRKSLMKFMLALKRANVAASALADSPLSFVGGFLPPEEEPEEVPDPAPIPRRARPDGIGLKGRRNITGKDKEDG